MKGSTVARNHPAVVNATSVLVTAALLLGGHLGFLPVQVRSLDPLHAVASSAARSDLITVNGALAGVAAMVAGFAGVILVFIMQSDSARWVGFRAVGGSAVRRNATSPVSTAFVAAAVAIMGAITAAVNAERLSVAAALAASLLLIHASARLLWMLSNLTKIVAAKDRDDLAGTTRAAEVGFFGPPDGTPDPTATGGPVRVPS